MQNLPYISDFPSFFLYRLQYEFLQASIKPDFVIQQYQIPDCTFQYVSAFNPLKPTITVSGMINEGTIAASMEPAKPTFQRRDSLQVSDTSVMRCLQFICDLANF